MKKSKPYMKSKEWNFLISHLNSEDIMLEYGSGSSTTLLGPLVKKLVSLEHDKKWYEKVLNENNLANVELCFVPPDSPRTIPTQKEQFLSYINWVTTRKEIFTKVLIDGRARQWCAESILDNLAENHLVFLHDYNLIERPYYQRVLDFYEIIDKCHTMIMLKKK